MDSASLSANSASFAKVIILSGVVAEVITPH